jgi:hypothetical protein
MPFSVFAPVATLLVVTTVMSAPTIAIAIATTTTTTPMTTTTVDLSCRMTVPETVLARDAVPLKFEILNRHKKPVNVLIWNTPMEGFFGRYLRVIGPSGELDYGGAMMKRGAPERSDYARIKAGGSISKTVNLAKVFKFSAGERYTVEFIGPIFDATTEKVPRALAHHVPAAVACPHVAFSIHAEK